MLDFVNNTGCKKIPMTSIHTRLATQLDLNTVAVLFDAYRQFYEQEPNLPQATRFIADRIRNCESVIILAEDVNNKVVGFCQLYPSFCSIEMKQIYSLYDLYVSPNSRRSGTGKLLLLAAEEHARNNGISRMDLTTAKTNFPAQSLYNSLGWIRDDVFNSYSKHTGAKNLPTL